MSHAVELTDEQYETLRQVAARAQETPEQLLGRMVNALTKTQGSIYYTDDDFLRALGANDQELAALAQLDPNLDSIIQFVTDTSATQIQKNCGWTDSNRS